MQPGERESAAVALVEGALGDLGERMSAAALDFARESFGPAAALGGILRGHLPAGGVLFEADGLRQPGVHQGLRLHPQLLAPGPVFRLETKHFIQTSFLYFLGPKWHHRWLSAQMLDYVSSRLAIE